MLTGVRQRRHRLQAEKLLDATAAGVFRKAKLFTRDLLSQRHFAYAIRLQAPREAGQQPAAGGAQTAAAAAAKVAITDQAALLIELGLLKFDPPGEPAGTTRIEHGARCMLQCSRERGVY